MRQLFDSAGRGVARGVRTAAFLAGLAAVSPAFAEDAAVEALIQRGIQLRRNSDDEDALAVFLEAEKQDPKSVRVLLHVVTAAQAAGKWLMADSYMRKVTVLNDDPYYRRHADAIDVVRRAIAARVGTFQAQGGPDGASVRLDGQLVGTLPMNDPVPVEAGAYAMEVHKPGFYRLRRNVTITGGVFTREPVELNQALARGDVGAGAGADGSGSGVGADRGSDSWVSSPAVGWSLIGVGAAAGVISGISFIMRENQVERYNDEDRCIRADGSSRLEACRSFKDDAQQAQTIGIATGVAGAVLVGIGITQLLTTQGSETTAAESASAPGLRLAGCDAGLMTLACHGSF
jgi:hypothetical protein